MSAPTLKAVILQAFTEGYVNGVNHTRGRSVVLESMRIGEAFWSRVRDEAEREFPAASSSSTPLSETPTTDILAAIAPVLAWHYLTGIECDHTAKTDVSTCACALWRSEPQPSVGAAIDRWVEHVLAAIRSGNSQLREATGFLAQENRANQETISPSLAPLSTTSSEVQCSGCGIVAKQIAKPETLVGLQHYCGGTWRRSSLAPLSETPSALKSNERIARHPNGHLMVEVLPWAPSEADEKKALDSLAKAYPYLEKHASHIDGEFDIALTNVRMMFARMRRSIADLAASAPPRFRGCGFDSAASLAPLSETPSEGT